MAEKKQPKDKRLVLAAVAAAALFVLINLQFFLGIPFGRGGGNVACFKDACIVGDYEPTQQIKDLLASSRNITIVYEGDLEKSQKTAYLSLAFSQLSKDFGRYDPALYSIGMEDGTAVNCFYSPSNKNYSVIELGVESCRSVEPGQDGLLFIVKYPAFSKDEIVVKGRSITFQGKSGEETLALVYLFEQLFIR